MHRRAAALFLLVLAGCAGPDLPEAVATPGAPVPGLDEGQLARFERGRTLFDRDFTEAQGLGPLFNQRRCSSCHDIPTPGGNGSELVTHVTRFEAPDRCDLLESSGGHLLQSQVSDSMRALGFRGERAPPEATAVVSMHAPPLYGLGLLEAVDEDAILELADPGDDDGDGISGRAVRLPDGRLGRFGRKLAFATVRDFTEDALHGELGLTTPAHPIELTLNGEPLLDFDPAPDPEVNAAVVNELADYLRMLAAPEREIPASSAAADSIETGRRAFMDVGCADCHTPELPTVSADLPALDGRRVALFSDLLLHDMGDELAGTCGAFATPTEWRTAPLLGLRFRSALLHNGRTQSFRGAIEAHGGEGAAARLRFFTLDPGTQEMLLRFLGSI